MHSPQYLFRHAVADWVKQYSKATGIDLDFIDLPADGPEGLARKSFGFPARSEDGCIDGSIYLLACHCPVDVTRIALGEAYGDVITAILQVSFNFERARGIAIRNRAAQLDVTLRYEGR